MNAICRYCIDASRHPRPGCEHLIICDRDESANHYAHTCEHWELGWDRFARQGYIIAESGVKRHGKTA